MKPPIELYRPTILNIIAIISYLLATMFHIIAYATDNWASLLLDDVRWRMGLWQGCTDLEGTEYCTTDIFDHEAFQTGMSSDWHLGARVMMTLALILLFFLEFTLIGYACIKSLERFKTQLVGTTIALSLSTAFSHFLVLIMYGTEVNKIPGSQVKASYGVVIICLFIELFLPCFIYVDNNLRFPTGKSFLIPKRFLPKQAQEQAPKRTNDRSKDKQPPAFTIDGASVSMRTSTTSLTELETYKRFAIDEQPDPSLISIGSINSLNTRSTMYTNVSLTDRTSLESGV